MPRVANTAQFLAGIITAKMGELQAILDILASPEELTESEMRRMRDRINLIDSSVRQHHRDINIPQLRPKMTFYNRLLELTVTEMERRERHHGRMAPESEAMRARRLRNDEDYEPYASDGTGPVPLEYWGAVSPAPPRVPISANDLRRALENRRTGREQRNNWSPPNDNRDRGRQNELESDEPGPSGIQRVQNVSSPSKMDTDDSSASTGGHRTRENSPASARSRSSLGSYVSSRQSTFSRPVSGVPLPPVLEQIPFKITRGDRDLIDRSEIYVRRTRGNPNCPYCNDDHRLHQCKEFPNLRLVDRWYQVLNMGICLNCLRPGHSSFRCIREGACTRCGLRHNSLLCRRNPTNK